MKTALTLLCVFASFGAFKFLSSVIDRIGFAGITGIGILFFSAFFIYTVKNAQTENLWNFQISPQVREHVGNVFELAIVLIIFFVAVVILVAIAGTGQLTLMESLTQVIKSLPRLLDV
jgi:hypothetical protein